MKMGEFEVYINSNEKNCKLIVSYIGYNNYQKKFRIIKKYRAYNKNDH